MKKICIGYNLHDVQEYSHVFQEPVIFQSSWRSNAERSVKEMERIKK